MPLVLRHRSTWLPVAAAIVIASLAVARLSAAALTSVEPAAVWVGGEVGEVTLADEPVVAGLFDVDGMLPGRTEVRCVTVRYEGSRQPASVRLYATGVSGGLAPLLDVRVEVAPACDAFPPVAVVFAGPLAAMPGTWVDAAEAWLPAAGERRAYRFSVTLRDEARAESQEATAGFVWEARPHRSGAAGTRPHPGGTGVAGLG